MCTIAGVEGSAFSYLGFRGGKGGNGILVAAKTLVDL